MKKIALVLAVLLCALPMMAFAEIAVTGSVSFSIGDSTESETTLPVFSGASSVAGSISIATDDEKVVASATFNLLPTVTTTYTPYDDGTYSTAGIYPSVSEYGTYGNLEALVGFYNDHADDETAVDEVTIWATGAEAALEAELVDGTFEMVASDDEADEITITAPVKADAETDEFVWTVANATSVGTIQGAFKTELESQLSDAIENILAEAATATKADLTAGGVSLTAYAFGTLATYLGVTTTYDVIKDWSADDKAVVKQALDLDLAYSALFNDGLPTVTSTLSFIESASLAFNNVGGVVDIVANLKGTHVGAGMIMADGAGHSSTAVSGYPSLMVGLSSGVVEGVNAGVTLYIDDNDVQDAVSDTYYTWLDETESQVDPAYGLGLSAGYTMATDDMTVGASLAFGMYDLMGDMAWAFSVAPMFSGMGANVGVQFDYGMDMMYLMASVDYTIMGITPSVAFHYLANTGDNVLAYAASTSSVMADYKNSDGMLLEAGVMVDLTELVGMGVSVNGGMDYDLTDSQLAWNAGVSAAGLVDGLTVGFACDADVVEGSTFDWAVSASYMYSIATLSASFGSDYSTADETNYTTWSLGTSVSF